MYYCFDYNDELIDVCDNQFDAECLTDCGETGYVLTPWKLGVCAGRHDMPVEGYIIGSIDDPTDIKRIKKLISENMERYFNGNALKMLDLYVTGLTVVLVEILNWCRQNGITVTLYHYNRETGNYYVQEVS